MKTLLTALLAAVTCIVSAADNVVAIAQPIAEPAQNFRAGEFNIDAFGVLSRPDLTGAPRWGAGVGVGYYITRGLGVGVRGIAYNTDEWGGSTIDEGEARILFRAPLWDRIAPYGFVSGIHNFENGDWGAGAGGGLELRLTKRIGIFGETGIKITTEGANGWGTSAGVRFTF